MTVRTVIVVAGLALLLAPVTVHGQDSGLPGGCAVDGATTVDVLLLLDQSGSLSRTDPDGQRISGAQAVVRSYAALAERVGEIRIQVAGFGTVFSGSGWSGLTSDTSGEVLDEVARAGAVDSELHTDYVYAVSGAVEAFADSAADCRILFWFTDGAHDLDVDLLGDGLDRFYHPEPVTIDNVDEVETRMLALICDTGGFADELDTLGVSTQVLLLGDGQSMGEASRRVLRGLGGDPSFDCGAGNGSFQDVGSADELPFRMACASQLGSIVVPVQPADGSLIIDEGGIDAGGVPHRLATDLIVIARGSPQNAPTIAGSTLAGLTELPDVSSGTIQANVTLTGEPFEIEMTGVADACAFVAATPPTPIVTSDTPTLYQAEEGVFAVVLQGPHGLLPGAALPGLEVTATEGTVTTTDTGWTVTVPALPTASLFELTVTATAPPLPPAAGTATFTLNEQLNAPRVVGQPDRLVAEGVGPFLLPLEVDGQDGGVLCLDESVLTLPTASDDSVTATATLEGEECLDVPAGEGQTFALEVTLDDAAFVDGTLDVGYVSTSQSRPDRSEEGSLAVSLALTPVANTALVAAIVGGLLALFLGLLWATLFGVNRLVSRIPDPRRNGVRFADFAAEVRPGPEGDYQIELTETPSDRDLRLPRRTESELHAGRLKLSRRVPVLPWRPPYAELSNGSDVVMADLGRGVTQRTTLGDRVVNAQPSDGLGPIVVLGISTAQRAGLADGTPQRVPGVLLMDIRQAKGMDATEVSRNLIGDSLARISTELTVTDDIAMERTSDT